MALNAHQVERNSNPHNMRETTAAGSNYTYPMVRDKMSRQGKIAHASKVRARKMRVESKGK